jgi:hypothetical protein
LPAPFADSTGTINPITQRFETSQRVRHTVVSVYSV